MIRKPTQESLDSQIHSAGRAKDNEQSKCLRFGVGGSKRCLGKQGIYRSAFKPVQLVCVWVGRGICGYVTVVEL